MRPRQPQRGRRPTRRRPGARDGEDLDSSRYEPPPKKSNTGLMVGVGIGVAAVVVIGIVAFAGSGSSGGRKRYSSRKRPQQGPVSSGKKYGGEELKLTADVKAKLAEAAKLENAGRSTLNQYFGSERGSYFLKKEHENNKPQVLAAVRKAIDGLARRTALHEEVLNQTGESFDEGKSAGRLMKTLKSVRRELEASLE